MRVNRCHAHVLVPAEIDSMLLPGASVPPACTATVPVMLPEPPSVPPDTVTAELARELFPESRPPVTLVAPVYVWAEESTRLPVPPLVNEPEAVREDPTTVLRPRELEVFTLVGKGMTSRQIAESLGVSIHTVSTHRQAIVSKLGVAGAELVRLATVSNQTR